MDEHMRSQGALPVDSAACPSVSWQPVLEGSLRSQALEATQVVAQRLRDPDHVIALAQLAKQQAMSFWGWSPSSLSSGFGSTALLFLFLARSFPEQNWEYMARDHLRLAAEHTRQQPLMQPGLFGGSSGLASVVALFAQDDRRYQRTAHILNERVAQQVLQTQWRRGQASGVADADYDIITGAAGILGYLSTLDQSAKYTQEAIQQLLGYLIWLAERDEAHGYERWFLPPELYPTELQQKSYPDGYFNCGLAHGIPGPLAALSAAWHAGHRVPGQQAAIRSLVRWIIDHQLRASWGISWPAGVPLRQSYSRSEWSMLPPSRDAWCYGSPGISRALWLAGTALDDTDLCHRALEAIESVLQRSITMRRIDSVTFCHGVAGQLAICLRFAHETNSTIVHQHIPRLTSQILNEFNPCHPAGFRDLEQEDNWVDDPGLLTGAVGVALTLLAASTSIEPTWHRIFLIA
ncbi:lanthionine synthetase [Ktedonosporobacter rubrisoli]|uniref:Lanthionine synthetase n=1 Tax=Ktedonosporobacter rubrisoli TaxID=2509675 RepID=A0A4P6K4I4_KTERU|nr:lanthionine synthetase C family protein [Ktedonosporobacter rubrisoli]QBD82872.1 lanthionine synthetase [Ktedonosporobacter rubrisoli]